MLVKVVYSSEVIGDIILGVADHSASGVIDWDLPGKIRCTFIGSLFRVSFELILFIPVNQEVYLPLLSVLVIYDFLPISKLPFRLFIRGSRRQPTIEIDIPASKIHVFLLYFRLWFFHDLFFNCFDYKVFLLVIDHYTKYDCCEEH